MHNTRFKPVLTDLIGKSACLSVARPSWPCFQGLEARAILWILADAGLRLNTCQARPMDSSAALGRFRIFRLCVIFHAHLLIENLAGNVRRVGLLCKLDHLIERALILCCYVVLFLDVPAQVVQFPITLTGFVCLPIAPANRGLAHELPIHILVLLLRTSSSSSAEKRRKY